MTLQRARPWLTSDPQAMEEIQAQHVKKILSRNFFERVEARMENFFGMVVKSSEERAVEGLVDRAKVIVGWPDDKKIVLLGPVSRGSVDRGDATVVDNPRPLRLKSGELTEEGCQQLMNGTFVMDPDDVVYRDDAMRYRPKTTEIVAAVGFVNWLSDRINAKLGLDEKSTIRVNFRYMGLADYRVLGTVVVVLWIRSKLS